MKDIKLIPIKYPGYTAIETKYDFCIFDKDGRKLTGQEMKELVCEVVPFDNGTPNHFIVKIEK